MYNYLFIYVSRQNVQVCPKLLHLRLKPIVHVCSSVMCFICCLLSHIPKTMKIISKFCTFFKVLDADLDASNTTFTRLANEWEDREQRHQHLTTSADEVNQLANGNVHLCEMFCTHINKIHVLYLNGKKEICQCRSKITRLG